MRHVVIWSGGMDSTLILHNLAKNSSEENPIRACTITQLENINKFQMQSQEIAQQNYLKYAKEKGFHIEQLTIKVNDLNLAYPINQTTVWACLIIPMIRPNDILHFGYIRGDDFWHSKNEFEKFIKYGCLLKGISRKELPTIEFDLEWKNKTEVSYAFLTRESIPIDCFWTCEEVDETLKSCGKCIKCKEIDIIC